MGKDEPAASSEDATEDNTKTQDTDEEKKAPSSTSEKKTDTKDAGEMTKTAEAQEESNTADQSKNGIRKVIKFDGTVENVTKEEGGKKSEEKTKETTTEDAEKNQSENKPATPSDEAPPSREELEQRRNLLQNMKDFDFQIKKNQEDINKVTEKIDALSKDLDDLVSLYEIVSEQMNPFVGLSKVTKRRIDALENFTKEMDTIKERMGELESFAEQSGAKLKSLSTIQENTIKKSEENEVTPKETPTEELTEDVQDPEIESELEEKVPEDAEPGTEDKKETTDEGSSETQPEITPIEKADSVVLQAQDERLSSKENDTPLFSDERIDMILEQAFGTLSLNKKLDGLIDDFIEEIQYN